MKNSRPIIFVGSSSEGLPFAKALQVNLDHACQVVIWSQGVFGLSNGTLEDLATKLENVDFAALIITPDDLVESRGQSQSAPRDNVLLELGMSIGALGRDRSFVVYDRSAKPKLPSDLAGVTPATFEPHDDGNHQAALGAACTLIENKVATLGTRIKVGKIGQIDEHSQFQVLADLLGYPAANYIIQFFETGKTLEREQSRLANIGRYWYAIDFPGKYIGNGRFSIDDLCRKLLNANIIFQDLAFHVGLTERGKDFAKWLIKNEYKADAFKSPLGSWGQLSDMHEITIKHLTEGT
ncbi:MAG: TIR domain-containing protein [Cyanobacteria bacterium J06642_2]